MITKKFEVTKIFEKTAFASKSIIVNIGGAGSSKSYSLAQLFCEKFGREYKKKFLVVRKTFRSLKFTDYMLMIDLFKKYGIYEFFEHNRSDHTIYYPQHDNLMIFIGLDDPEKIKSAEFNYIWMEEANDFSYKDFIILNLRLRAQTNGNEPNRIYLSLNPIDELGWINQKLLKDHDCEVIYSTYNDNPFLNRDYVREIEALKYQDESYYQIYALGQFAKVKGQIYGPLDILEEFPEVPEEIYGLDFGFRNPTALIRVGIDLEGMSLYLAEALYERELTNAQLIERMKELIPNKRADIYADSAEPARIEEIYQHGFNIKPAEKEVAARIDMMKRFKKYSKREYENLNREFAGYKNKVDKNDNVLEEPVKWADHTCDAAGYAAYTHLKDRLFQEEGVVYHRGMKRPLPKEEELVPEGPFAKEIRERAVEMIREHGYASSAVLAHSLGISEEAVKARLCDMGFREHRKNRFIYGPDLQEKIKKAKPEKKEERYDEGTVYTG